VYSRSQQGRPKLFGNGIRIGKWFGIEISIDGSWLVIAFLVAWSFSSIYSTEFTELTGGTAIALGTLTAALFFVSVLLHEISHSLMARRLGMPVHGITLFIFGGVTKTGQEAKTARDEFWVAIVGPLTSVAIAGVLWAVVNLTGEVLPEPVSFGLGYLGWLNLALGVFNMLPGFPLDGGRVLRAAIWRSTGSFGKATRGATTGGKILASILIGLGLFVLFGGNLGGLWYAAIGWFLYQAASGAGQEVLIRQILRDVRAGELMSPDPVTIPAGTTLREAVDEYFLRFDHSAFPVHDEGKSTGILTLHAVRQVPRDDWEIRQVWSAMTPLKDACTVSPNLGMDSVLEKLRDEDHERVLVVDDGNVAGIITPRDVSRWIRRSQELGTVDSVDA